MTIYKNIYFVYVKGTSHGDFFYAHKTYVCLGKELLNVIIIYVWTVLKVLFSYCDRCLTLSYF